MLCLIWATFYVFQGYVWSFPRPYHSSFPAPCSSIPAQWRRLSPGNVSHDLTPACNSWGRTVGNILGKTVPDCASHPRQRLVGTNNFDDRQADSRLAGTAILSPEGKKAKRLLAIQKNKHINK